MHYNFEKDEISEEKEREMSGRGSTGKTVLEYVVTFAVIAAVIYLLQAFVIINARIPSASMENTIMTGERLFGNRLAYTFGEPERYDIVIFKYPDDESQLFIKRVIGLPGETIIITDGKVYAVGCYTDTSGVSDETLINDPMYFDDTIKIDDSFIKESMNTDESAVFRVPDDGYFMMGDNRNNSIDSRYWTNKFVTKDQILGKASLRYWPLNKISILGYNGNSK